jgi:hypothetical protein
MQPRSFRVEIRIALIEPMTSSTNSSTSLGQLLASARFARDQTPPSGLGSGRSIVGQGWRTQACSACSPSLAGSNAIDLTCSLVRSKEEDLVLLDWPSNAESKLVLFQTRPSLTCFVREEVIRI